MKIAIVDDEKYFIDEMIGLLHNWSDKKISLDIFAFSSGEEMIAQYESGAIPFDLLFLDITLGGGMDGLEAARRLRTLGYEGEIVFTTNHQDFKYAQQSLRVRALNYYAKPISPEDIASCMETLLQNNAFTYLYNGKRHSIPYKEILFFESKRNYVKLHLKNPEDTVPMYKSNMVDLCKALPKTFIRCHRSYVVNMLHVVAIEEQKLYLRGRPNAPLNIGEMYLEDILSYFTKL